MQQAKCPQCQQKLQLPDDLPEGMMLQCAGCGSQFLPPEQTLELSIERSGKKKKKKGRKAKSKKSTSSRSVALAAILGAIVLLLGGLATMWLMQPSYSKFNDQIIAQYNKFSGIMQSSIAQRPGANPMNNITSFLKQFEKLGPQLKPMLAEIQAIRAPEDEKHILDSLSRMVESTIKFSQQEVPKYLEELKKKPNNEETLRDMVRSLLEIAEYHDALIGTQLGMAKKHGLLQLQPPTQSQFFLPQRRQ